MATTGIDAIAGSGSAALVGQTKTLDRDDFLNLLIAQLQHQDPLNPTDSTEFTAQLAQFSSLEQLGNINANLKALEQYQSAISNTQALALIGKAITAEGDSIQLAKDQSAECQLVLAKDADSVMVSIYDRAGEFVKRIEAGPLPAGRHSVKWDGTNQNGGRMPAGLYSFEGLATDAQNRPIAIQTLTVGQVTAVSFENDTAYLSVGPQKVPFRDVVDVRIADGAADQPVDPAATSYRNQPINGGK